jgi:hypothetical protein
MVQSRQREALILIADVTGVSKGASRGGYTIWWPGSDSHMGGSWWYPPPAVQPPST